MYPAPSLLVIRSSKTVEITKKKSRNGKAATSKYKGVTFREDRNKFVATKDVKHYNLSCFNHVSEALKFFVAHPNLLVNTSG